jgi:hypothetical protein
VKHTHGSHVKHSSSRATHASIQTAASKILSSHGHCGTACSTAAKISPAVDKHKTRHSSNKTFMA